MRHRVLLIEDNGQNAYMVEYLLASVGIDVVHAARGLDGLSRASEGGWSLVLLDIQLPDVDGYEVATRLRAMAGLEETPVVAVTSYAMPGDRERAITSGCTHYIEKPIDPDTFLGAVLALIDPGGQARGERRGQDPDRG